MGIIRLFTILIICLLSLQGIGQSLDNLKKRFAEGELRSQKVVLSIPQFKYFPGDTIFFKAYLLNSSNQKIGGREILQALLVDHEGKVSVQMMFEINDGLGYNQMILPDSLAEGMYAIVALSNWMKNFDSEDFYQYPIKVVQQNEINIVQSNSSIKLNDQETILNLDLCSNDSLVSFSFFSKNRSLTNQEISWLVSSPERIIWDSTLIPSVNASDILRIPRSSLDEGMHNLTFFGKDGKMIASRNFYIPSSDRNVELKVGARKDSISLDVVLSEKGSPIQADFSIAVLNNQIVDSKTIPFEYVVSHPSVAMNGINSEFNRDSCQNHFMLKSSIWEKFSKYPNGDFKYRRSNILKMEGRAYLSNGDPLPDNSRIAFYMIANQVSFESWAYKDGEFLLLLPGFYGMDSIFYYGETENGDELFDIKIEWKSNSLDLNYINLDFELTDTDDQYATFSRKKRIIDSSYQYYQSKSKDSLLISSESKLPLGDASILLKDYANFSTMQEVVREILPFAFFRVRNKEQTVRVSLSKDMMLKSTGDPLFIIDGRPTKNTSEFLAIKPENVIKIDVVIKAEKLKPWGFIGKNGFIVVTTKRNFTQSQRYDLIRGLNRPIDFNKIVSSSAEIPNFRSLIYWNPYSKTNHNGARRHTFWLSDDPVDLLIVIEGITTSGHAFSHEYLIPRSDYESLGE